MKEVFFKVTYLDEVSVDSEECATMAAREKILSFAIRMCGLWL